MLLQEMNLERKKTCSFKLSVDLQKHICSGKEVEVTEEKAAKPVTAVQDCVLTFALTPFDISDIRRQFSTLFWGAKTGMLSQNLIFSQP